MARKKASRRKSTLRVSAGNRKTAVKKISGRHLVKRHGHIEPYDKRKIYASVYSAAMHAHHTEIQSENLADQVMKICHSSLMRKKTMSSTLIRYMILEHLEQLNKEVRIVYEHLYDFN